jgi:hypothetical protein
MSSCISIWGKQRVAVAHYDCLADHTFKRIVQCQYDGTFSTKLTVILLADKFRWICVLLLKPRTLILILPDTGNFEKI